MCAWCCTVRWKNYTPCWLAIMRRPMPDNNKNFNIDDAFQHTACTPDGAFKEDLREKLHQRYQNRKAAPSSAQREEPSRVVFGAEPMPESWLGRLSSALSGKMIPAFTLAFMVLLAVAL